MTSDPKGKSSERLAMYPPGGIVKTGWLSLTSDTLTVTETWCVCMCACISGCVGGRVRGGVAYGCREAGGSLVCG